MPQPVYIIVAPPYTKLSAGVWALHKFANDLRILGVRAFVHVPACFQGAHELSQLISPFDTPHVSDSEAQEILAAGGQAVYPECLSSNPLGVQTCIRYLLNKVAMSQQEYHRRYGAFRNEFYLSFSRIFNLMDCEADAQLFVPHIDDSIFWNRGKPLRERKIVCYYHGKGSADTCGLVARPTACTRNHLAEGDTLLSRDNPSLQRSWEQLAELFNESHLFYCYDNMTVLINMAVFCGCPVVLIPNGWFSREEYREAEWGLEGIAIGEDPREITRAIATVRWGTLWYEGVKTDYGPALRRFVDRTAERPPNG